MTDLPTADPELAALFLRARTAWEKWRLTRPLMPLPLFEPRGVR